jgi:hypothetical protein
VPVKDENGKVVYKEVVKTFSGHGKLVVSYQTKEVKDHVFLRWNQNVIEDANNNCYTDSKRGVNIVLQTLIDIG